MTSRNQERARKIALLLSGYALTPAYRAIATTVSDEDFCDALADMFHLAASLKIDMKAMIARAENHFECEQEEDS